MTTKGEKLRRKRGRPRMGDVPREPSGRVSRSGIEHEPADVVALDARVRQTGLTREQARDQKAATFIGYLNLIGKVDAVIADIPYGTTRCAWDIVIPFDKMWTALKTVRERDTPIVLFGSEPFSSLLRTSNLKEFRYDWIWHKPKGTGFLNAKRRPLVCHEKISVFAAGSPRYFPQKTSGHPRRVSVRREHLQTDVYGHMANDYHYDSTDRYPRSVQTFEQDTQNSSLHRTQKPVGLMEYLIKTYTAEGDTVLDFTMGSATTGIAAKHTKRKFIGIEIKPEFFDVACVRIQQDAGPLFATSAA